MVNQKEFIKFRENVDGWIRQIIENQNIILNYNELVDENNDNIEHNYELIYELKEEIETLKEELRTLKLMQLLQLNKKKLNGYFRIVLIS